MERVTGLEDAGRLGEERDSDDSEGDRGSDDSERDRASRNWTGHVPGSRAQARLFISPPPRHEPAARGVGGVLSHEVPRVPRYPRRRAVAPLLPHLVAATAHPPDQAMRWIHTQATANAIRTPSDKAIRTP